MSAKKDQKEILLLPQYAILDVNRNDEVKFAISVQIGQKFPNNLLEAIASAVVEKTGVKSRAGIVFFLTPEIRLDNGAWAAVQFDPTPVTKILGLSIEDEHRIRLALDRIESYEGLWIDNTMQGDVIIRIRKGNSGKYFFEYISSKEYGPSAYASEVIKTLQNGKTFFVDTEKRERFILKENGDLDVFDNDGYVLTYQRIK
jgi:hypothetical protein